MLSLSPTTPTTSAGGGLVGPLWSRLWYRPARREDVGRAGEEGALTESARRLVDRALAGDAVAVRALVAELTPVIQASAATALRRRVFAKGADARQLVDDILQDVFVELFRDRGKLLQSWDPARGKGLHGFVALVAVQRVGAVLRSRRKNPWAEELTPDGAGLDEVGSVVDPELRIASRQAVAKLFERVHGELSPLGVLLFQRLILDEEPIAGVAASLDMSVSAVQAWSSRLKRLLAKHWIELADEPAGGA